jgi:hypothetical protein
MKETTYQQKIPLVEPWIDEIIEAVKRDLKTEHLKKDPSFCSRYFMGKMVNQLNSRELALAYVQDIREGNIALAEFIVTRWLLKNTDIYSFFEDTLGKITADFETLKELDSVLAHELKTASVKKFGAKDTFIFALFNCVVFSEGIYNELREAALQEKVVDESDQKIIDCEKLKERYERKIAALSERYEKKLSGFQKKYLQDIALLKKKLAEKNADG